MILRSAKVVAFGSEGHPISSQTHPTALRQQKVNDRMFFAVGPPNLMQRLCRLPAAPHVNPLHRGKPYPSRMHYKHHL